MAENVEWILQSHSENSKAFIWAHNVRIGDWVSNGIIDVLGHQLEKRFGESFIILLQMLEQVSSMLFLTIPTRLAVK
jgi:erythromycin esterase-like protein